ncbi:MAG: flippase-like domain-containing protein [Nitrospiraceae bacterium]|nr:flippase-like domain-containing protein [Nitrospiraceae bacterium]
MNRFIALIVKLAVSAALIYLLASKFGLHGIFQTIKGMNLYVFAAAVVMYWLATFVSCLRWRLFIPHKVSINRLFSFYLIGAFFNTCMPGMIGGDAVKAYYLNKELKSSSSNDPESKETTDLSSGVVSVASVFMDRYMGAVCLITLCLAGLPVGYAYISSTPLVWLLPAVAAVFVIASAMIFCFKAGTRFEWINRSYRYFDQYKRKSDVLLKAYGYSLVVQLMSIVSAYIVALGLGINQPFIVFFVFFPLIIFVSMMPISISGIGLREGAFVVLLGTVGTAPEKAVAISLVWFLSVAAAGLAGLVEYLRIKSLSGGYVEKQSL